jgi:hypothetical protein
VERPETARRAAVENETAHTRWKTRHDHALALTRMGHGPALGLSVTKLVVFGRMQYLVGENVLLMSTVYQVEVP